MAQSIACGQIDPITCMGFDQENSINNFIKSIQFPKSRNGNEANVYRSKNSDDQKTTGPSKYVMPKACDFKTAFSGNQKFVVKKSLTLKSDYFSFKNLPDGGPLLKKRKPSQQPASDI